ncbi:MAG TPA: universal stress protein [Rhizobiales bacterium]|nr:universal stress protein F [bacterium BMS3Bbin10]HDO52452.1 universal stress protein [Hyphomicrobiales bacterium]
MYQTILLPIDLAHTEKCKAMLDIAKELGGKGARFILINVIEDIPAYVMAQVPGEIIKKIRKNAQTELKGMAKAAGLRAEIEVRSGSAATAILSAADAIAADLIVIASHKPGLQDYLLGSTASRIVRHANCTVLVIR